MSARVVVLLVLAPAQARSDGLEAVREALRRASPHQQVDTAVLVNRLAALGPEAVPLLYGLANGRHLAELAAPEWRPEDWLCLPEEIPLLGARALEHAPRAAVLSELTRALDGGPTLQERLILLRLLGAQGSAALPLVWRVVPELGELELGRPSARRELRAALSSILSDDPRAWTAVEEDLDALEPALLEVLVEAVGESGCARGMGFLRGVLGRRALAPESVLGAMATLEEARPWELAGQTFLACSGWLEDLEPARRAYAARLAGRLHEDRAVPALIALVEDASSTVRAQGLAALRALAGADHGQRPEGWEAWYEAEEAWREKRWESLVAQLVSPRAGAANEALTELLGHPLHRREVTLLLAETLLAQPRAVALSSCTELGRSGSRAPLPLLLRALGAAPPQLAARIQQLVQDLVAAGHEMPLERIQQLVNS